MSTIPPVTDPRFDPNYGEPYEPKKKRSPWATCLIGCLIVAVILGVLGVVAFFWIVRNFRGWATDAISEGIKQGINASELPPQEKIEINEQVDRVANAVRNGQLSNQQLVTLMENLAESPLMTSVMVAAIEQKYFAGSQLTAEEKAAGRVTLQRFLRGMVDDKIDQQQLDTVLEHVANRQPDGGWELRQNVSDADLRAMLAAAKSAADMAGVAAEPPAFDPSDEFKRIIDEALAQPRAAVEPAPMPGDAAEPER